MKTVLIVEDEKMIRQGIHTMIQRCDVPVDTILECNNGEKALEILTETEVDLVFTDIRMPKMNGIELVRRIQQFERKPIVVAISGYADFNYAVEMLKSGVREYLLKPIERDKLQELLRVLEDEINQKKLSSQTNQKLGCQQLKYILLNAQATESELDTLERKYENEFHLQQYSICVLQAKEENLGGPLLYLHNIEDNDVYLLTEEMIEEENWSFENYIGISSVHCGIRQLRQAYKEAIVARKKAFCTNVHKVYYEECKDKKIPESFLTDARQLIEPEMQSLRVQLIGTDRTEEMAKSFNRMFEAVKKEWLKPLEFSICMDGFFSEVQKTYKNIADEDKEQIKKLEKYYCFSNLDQYENAFMNWLFSFHEKMNDQLGKNKNLQRITQAIDYIHKNYNKELNMAMVSNYISMNYSLFSYLFKEHTGSNFVNYVKQIRMEEAKKFLTETDMKVVEISQKIGYDNEKHFMKTFKAVCGVSPSEYRKNTQSNQMP